MSVREATKENFHELIQENVVVVEFFSDSCLPCQLMSNGKASWTVGECRWRRYSPESLFGH